MGKVTIRKDVEEEDQREMFQNATLQGEAAIAFSIATFVKVPSEVYAQGQDAVAGYLHTLLGEREPANVTYEIEIGPAKP